jgi:hypothetical protein
MKSSLRIRFWIHMDPHYFEKLNLDLDPHKSEKSDVDPHEGEKMDSDPQ